MNSVVRRSLRNLNSSVLQRQLRTSTAIHHIRPPHICDRAGWRQYSTHNNPDGFKDKSAVGVSQLAYTPFCCPAQCNSGMQVFTPKAATLFILAGAGLYFYFRLEKQRLQEQKRQSVSSLPFGYVLKNLEQRRRRSRALSAVPMSVGHLKW